MLPIHMAPLQGYTDDAYRRLHAQWAGGVATYYTPFVRLEHGAARPKDIQDLLPQRNEGVPLVPQLICATREEMCRLLDEVQPYGYDRIDINMGCPAPMQTRHGRGSGLLPHPERVALMVQEMQRRPEVRFSVKMRLGLESTQDIDALLPILDDAPLAHITVHPRLGVQMYRGEVNMQAFARVMAGTRHAVIYNGDLRTTEQMEQIESQFPGLHALMLGRGLLARPTLAAEYASGAKWCEERRTRVLLAMHQGLLEHCTRRFRADSQILLHMHSFWEYQEEVLPRKVWKALMRAGSMRNYLMAVDAVSAG